MKITGDNIKIVSVDETDDQFDSLFDDIEDLYNMSETRLYPEGLPLEMTLKIIKDDEVVGQIKLSRIRWYNRKAEISLAVKKNYQKNGIGREALSLILNYAFNKMNLHRVEAEVIENNKPSLNLIKKFHFIEEGRLREAKYSNGKYWDILRYGLLKEEYRAN